MNAPETALEIKAFFAAIGAFGTALFGWVGANTWNKLLKGQ